MTWAYQPLPAFPASNSKLNVYKGKDYRNLSLVTSTAVTSRGNCRQIISNPQGTIAIVTRDSASILRTTSNTIGTWSTVNISDATRGTLGACFWFDSRFYIITDGLGVFRSIDALTWETIRAPDASGFLIRGGVKQFATNGSLHLVCGGLTDTILYSSTDFVNWTTLSSKPTSMYSILWDGTRFVISGGNRNIYTTADGVSLTLQASTIGDDIAFDGNTYYSTITTTYKTSMDLVTWSSASTITGITTDTNGIHIFNDEYRKPFNAKCFYLANETRGRTSYSLDGSTWIDISSGSFPALSNYADGYALLYDESAKGYRIIGAALAHDKMSDYIYHNEWELLEGRIKRSNGYDFSTMSSQTYSISGSNPNVGTTRSNADESIAITTGSGSNVNIIKSLAKNSYSSVSVSGMATGHKALEFYNDEFYVVDATLAVYKSSDDGANWSNIRSSSTTLAIPSTISENSTIKSDGSIWIIIANTNGSYYRSTDLGLNWSLELITGYAGTLKIENITFANNLFLACLDGDIYTSSDALTWTQYNPAFTVTNINYAFGYYIAAASGNIYTSTNLSSWNGPYTRPTAPGAAKLLYGVVEGQNCLWAFGQTGGCAVSFDIGVTWSTLSGNTTGGNPGLSTQSCMLGGLPFAMGFATVMYVAFVKYPLIEWINFSDRLNYYNGSEFENLEWITDEARPLDNYTTGLWGVFSVYRKLISSYTGPAIRVKRSLDNGEDDIPFATNRLDQDYLERFLAGSTGYIVTIYDQFSNKDLTAISGRQPELNITNPGLEFANFDSVDDQFVSSTLGSSISALTFFMKGSLNNNDGQVLIETSDSYSINNDTLAIYYLTAEGGMNVATHGVSSTFARSSFGDIKLNENVHTYRIDRSAVGGVNQCNLFVNGVIKSRTGNADSGTISGTFANLPLRIGARGSSSITLGSDLELFDLCVYSSAISNDMIYNISQKLIK